MKKKLTEEEKKEKKRLYVKEYRKKNAEKIKQKRKEYYENNIEKIKDYDKSRYSNNKEEILSKQKEYRNKNKRVYSEEQKENKRLYRELNKQKINEYHKQYNKEKRENDVLFKIKNLMRCRLYESFRQMNYTKKSKTHQILGCSFDEFKEHLESKFEPWMTWDNHGLYNGEPNYGWDIDHIIPLSSATSEDDVIRLNHYSNLQPLCSYINRVIKRDN
jgi:hypothetical protein